MRQSQFSIKTLKEAPKDELALNARLLCRAGFIHKIGAGIYAYLPLGWRVMQKISSIVREEMNAVGGQELLLPALHPKKYWEKTGRWKGFDALYRISAHEDREYALGPTHEEIIVPVAKSMVQSYKDLPLYLYQIQTKFRDEPRAKSGILRGREFLMKDLYSFHATQDDLEQYYEKVAAAYEIIFRRCGLTAIRTKAGGGTFSKFSDEYQVLAQAGEDTIHLCPHCYSAWNEEIVEGRSTCDECGNPLTKEKAAEVGNIFKLGTKYAHPFALEYQKADGSKEEVIMGCYGIGISRVMGVVSELHNDERGLIWPKEIAPFDVHLLKFNTDDASLIKQQDHVYAVLEKAGLDVLYDDRAISDGVKLVESDLIGLPWRVIVSPRSLAQDSVEIKQRAEEKGRLVSTTTLLKELKG